MATKKDLVYKISKKLKYLSEDDLSDSVDSIIDYIKEEISSGKTLEIRGFGSMSLRSRKYAGKNENYNATYYRMSKAVYDSLNS